MSNGEYLRKARADISRYAKHGEFAAVAESPGLKELQEQIQTLRAEMNEAKRIAMAEAAKPYLEAIEQLEELYAFQLKISV